MFERLSVNSCLVVICGDFNVHVNDASCADAVRLADLLQSFGYVQHVTTATHTAGHTLDLVIARIDTDIFDVDVGGFISDHALVCFTIRVRKTIDAPQPVSCRAWKKYEKNVFACNLAASQLCSNIEQLSDKSADDLAVLYRDVMTQLLNKHCPVVTVCRRQMPATPRFDAECRDARRKARTAERRFRRKRTDGDKQVWADKLKAMREFYEAKRSSFWRTTILANSGNSQKLWRSLHKVLSEAVTEETGSKTADEFATYF